MGAKFERPTFIIVDSTVIRIEFNDDREYIYFVGFQSNISMEGV